MNKRKFSKRCNVPMGSYLHCKKIKLPKHMKEYLSYKNATHVSIDACLIPEIKKLWRKGIRTTGCCCGHNSIRGYIGVDFDDIEKMKNMGYKVAFNNGRPDDEDSFIPKTEKRTKKDILLENAELREINLKLKIEVLELDINELQEFF